MSEQCLDAQGCDDLTIPLNSNLSAGMMFETRDDWGKTYTKAFAQLRQDNEPLAEIYQNKGDAECLNTVGAGMQDELCGFEKLPYNNLAGDRFGGLNTGPPVARDFLREALKEGRGQQQTGGVNPFKYGFIGSSDTHLGTPGLSSELDYPGHGGAGLAACESAPEGLSDLIENNPDGLAVLWSEQNTRSNLFAAMKRHEAYATSGTRPSCAFLVALRHLPICAAIRNSLPKATLRACRWAAIFPHLRMRRVLRSQRCATRVFQEKPRRHCNEYRSSRAGSMLAASSGKGFMR